MNEQDFLLGKGNVQTKLTSQNARAVCPFCKSTKDITLKYSNKQLKEIFCKECGYLYMFFN